jgi:hypothetical protein
VIEAITIRTNLAIAKWLIRSERSALLRILPRNVQDFLSGRIEDHPAAMELVRKALGGDWRTMKRITDIVEENS